MQNSDRKKEFIKIMDGLDNSKSRYDHFRNFCEMAYCAIAKTTAPDQKTVDELEACYMAVVNSYANKDDVRKIPELLTLTVMALSDGGCDFLGELASELEFLDARAGQFFTPYEISKLLAHLNLGDAGAIINDQGFITVSDPAAGAGCTILAAADILTDQGYILEECMSVHVIELSKMTYHMLYVQLALKGIAAMVIHGNSLTLETFEIAYTPCARIFVGKHGRLFNKSQDPESKDSPRANIIIEPIINSTQLDFFAA